MSRHGLALAPLACFALVCAATGCVPTDCGHIAGSSAFGAFIVGGGGPYEAHLVCDTLPSSAPIEPEALAADGGACAPAAGDDACIACVKASCCVPGVTCGAEGPCACLVACRQAGGTEADCSACGEAGPAYDVAAACLADHCATQCPRFR